MNKMVNCFFLIYLFGMKTVWMAAIFDQTDHLKLKGSPTLTATSTTTEKHEIIPLLRYERQRNPDGSFHFTYEGADQSFREESAHVIDAETEDEALEVTGSYRYIDADGQHIEVHYTAGKNGFVPIGTNILPAISAAAKSAAESANNDDDDDDFKEH